MAENQHFLAKLSRPNTPTERECVPLVQRPVSTQTDTDTRIIDQLVSIQSRCSYIQYELRQLQRATNCNNCNHIWLSSSVLVLCIILVLAIAVLIALQLMDNNIL